MTPRADIDIRTVTEDGLRDWSRALSTGFLRSPEVTDTELAARRDGFLPGRTLGAYDGERCVATFRSFPQDLSVGAGTTVPADAISNVTVSPTHRRRGILTRMMAQDLAAAKERGDVVATLIAAEYPIYGRYGFGPATSTSVWTIDVPRTGLDPRWAGPADGGRIDLVDGADVRKLGPDLHARLARQQPGAVSRDERWWQVNTGLVRFGDSWDEPFYAVYRSADGEVEGLVSYEADDKWEAKQPHDTADVNWLITATPAAERALWQYLCSIDWITKVKTGWRAPDDLLPSSCRTRGRRSSSRTRTGCGCGSWMSYALWRHVRTTGRGWPAAVAASSWRSSTRTASPGDATGSRCPSRASAPACPVSVTPPNSPWTYGSWRRCGSVTSRRCGWRRWAGCGRNERAPPVRPTPCCVRPGVRGARTSSDPTSFPVVAAAELQAPLRRRVRSQPLEDLTMLLKLVTNFTVLISTWR